MDNINNINLDISGSETQITFINLFDLSYNLFYNNINITNEEIHQLRIYYQLWFNNESEIIQLLKTNLIDSGLSNQETIQILKDFYINNNIDIDLNIIDNIQPITYNINLSFNINRFIDLFSDYIDIDYNSYDNLEDIKCILDHSDKEILERNIIDKELNDECNICLEKYEINQNIITLPCKHYYHDNCINKWLEEYNYKCPKCRLPVGKPKYNI
jgi:hypothetical protein